MNGGQSLCRGADGPSKKLQRILAGLIVAQIFIGIIVVNLGSNYLNYLDGLLGGIYGLLPNHAWSSRSSYPKQASFLFLLSIPLFFFSLIFFYKKAASDISKKTWDLKLKFMAFVMTLFMLPLLLITLVKFDGADYYVLPLGSVLWFLALFSWAPSLLLSAGFSVSVALICKLFKE